MATSVQYIIAVTSAEAERIVRENCLEMTRVARAQPVVGPGASCEPRFRRIRDERWNR
jgi:hypothetical protein